MRAGLVRAAVHVQAHDGGAHLGASAAATSARRCSANAIRVRAHRLCCFAHKAVHLAPRVAAARRGLHARGGGVLGARRARRGCGCGVASGATQVDQHSRGRRRQRLRRRGAQRCTRLRAGTRVSAGVWSRCAVEQRTNEAKEGKRGTPGSAQRRAACLLPRAAACALRRAERRGPAAVAAAARGAAGAAEAAAAVCASQQRCRWRVARLRRRMPQSASQRRCHRALEALRRAAAAQRGAQRSATLRRASNREAARVSARIPARPWPCGAARVCGAPLPRRRALLQGQAVRMQRRGAPLPRS